MMLQYFKEKRVDIAIVETGLGGRLDSTNIIDPELSIITNISFDHTNILGNTLQEIAFEKAGIIKKNKPVVIGEASQELTALFKGVATGNNSPIFFAEEKYEILNSKPDINSLSVTLTHRASNLGKTYTTDLGGNYQLKNLRTVVLALDVLRQHFTITTEAINKGLSNVKDLTGLHGRWEKIADDPITILDVGHNEAGIKAILQQIQMLSFSTLHIVIGVVRDKDVTTILSLLPVEAVYYFTSAHIPRALPAEDLQSHAAVFSLKGDAYNSVNDALSKARSVSKKTDLIVVCGSVYLIGEVQRGT
jgi:dihydrofolate synthase/folylpolyglutamate synthase